jgi:hypothetical protein
MRIGNLRSDKGGGRSEEKPQAQEAGLSYTRQSQKK